MIGYVWPETNASAAGLRDWAFMERFRNAGWRVHYSSPAKPNSFSDKLQALGVPTFSCEANDSRFDDYIRELKPDYVLFDRFVIEEQFGWRVEESCPDAIRILDMQDFHALRRAREAALKELPRGYEQVQDTSSENSARIVERFAGEDLLRELSSIYRSDLTLVISSAEMDLLVNLYGIPRELLLLQRFSYELEQGPLPDFQVRRHFVSIGNFRHPPNADAIRWLKREIWPAIRERLREAEIHLFGAYPSREMMDLDDAASGFRVRGPAEDQYETLSKYRVLLAPLRFGAGIKGKIADAWKTGTPVVTTPVGAEGMVELEGDWPGEIALSAEALARSACDLYQNEQRWRECQASGRTALERFYNPSLNGRILLHALQTASTERQERRRANRVGALLRMNQHRSTKYFSRWIELKQQLARHTR